MFKKVMIATVAGILLSQATLPVFAQTGGELKYRSNLHTQMEQSQVDVIAANSDLTAFELIAENECLQLYVKPSSLAMKVVDVKTGYIWSSTIDNRANEKLNNTWQNYVDSALTITYIDAQNRTSNESITSDESEIQFKPTATGFEAKIKFYESKISVGLHVNLEGNDLVISLPQTELADSLKNKLVSVDVYPFLGASKNADIDGYMFVPDGSGALMRYRDGSKNKSATSYIGNVYGSDAGFVTTIQKEDLNPPEQIYVPVYGSVHGVNQNGLVSIIENGSDHAQIHAYPAGVSTDFNFIFSRFTYRQQYFQPTSKSLSGVNVYQDEMEIFDAKIRQRFVNGEQASYVGFAKEYQDYLVQQQVLSDKTGLEAMMRLEFLGGEQKQGLLFNSVIPMTTFAQASEIIQDLHNDELVNLDVLYRGYTKGGLSGTNPNHFPLESRIGNKNELTQLQQLVETTGDFGLYLDLVLADSQAKGYSGAKDVAKAASTATIATQKFDYTNFYLAPQKSLENANRDLKSIQDLQVELIAFPHIGTTSFTDSNKNQPLTRTQTQSTYQEIMETYADAGIDVALYRPTAQYFEFADKIYDLPMNSSQYIYFTDTVPFLQLVLKGYVDYHAPFANFYSDLTDDTLRMIEYGAFPSFYLTHEPTSLLKDSGSKDLFSGEYELWKPEIEREYKMMQETLSRVQGETMVNREVLANGVVKVTYSNEVAIYVNYTDTDVQLDGVSISAKNYLVR